jgi:hypothetical protein
MQSELLTPSLNKLQIYPLKTKKDVKLHRKCNRSCIIFCVSATVCLAIPFSAQTLATEAQIQTVLAVRTKPSQAERGPD